MATCFIKHASPDKPESWLQTTCFCLLCVILFSTHFSLIASSQNSGTSLASYQPNTDTIIVCGDSLVLMVDLTKSETNNPHIVWQWNAKTAVDLPEAYREQKFNSIDDCKAVEDGETMLISSSSWGVAVVEIESKKVHFYTEVANAHSLELLPGNKLAVAASTNEEGNKIVVFDLDKGGDEIFSDSLYSGHGVVWDKQRESLYALGFDVLREYKMDPDAILKKVNEWQIPGESGHDLQLTPDGHKLLLTEHHNAWAFDLATHQFEKIELPHQVDIKSLTKNSRGQTMYIAAEESWWAHHVRFVEPSFILNFPEIKLYKARWYDGGR